MFKQTVSSSVNNLNSRVPHCHGPNPFARCVLAARLYNYCVLLGLYVGSLKGSRLTSQKLEPVNVKHLKSLDCICCPVLQCIQREFVYLMSSGPAKFLAASISYSVLNTLCFSPCSFVFVCLHSLPCFIPVKLFFFVN